MRLEQSRKKTIGIRNQKKIGDHLDHSIDKIG